MKIAHRMYLTVVPALIGVSVVAALAYWGQYAHRVPHLVVLFAAAATVGALVHAWVNARYIAQRVERLAANDGATDELDAIESVVDRLSSAVALAESGRAESSREAMERRRDYATLMASIADEVSSRLEEIRLPLHILLENRFGELNDNQEEMLGAARAAAEAADVQVLAMRQLADLDRGARTLRHDRIFPGDLLSALVPTLQAQATKRKVTLHVDIEPLLPPIWGDQPQLQEALAILLTDAVSRAQTPALELHLSKVDAGCVRIVCSGGEGPRTVRTALATRLIAAMGGEVERESNELRIFLCRDDDTHITIV